MASNVEYYDAKNLAANDSVSSLRIVRGMTAEPEMDVENRILRNVIVCTRSLATDGWIIEPLGIDYAGYMENPIVTAGHDPETGKLGPVAGRTLSLKRSADGLSAETQFAETTIGKEYAYLYGLNPKKEIFMRAWSIDGSILQRSAMSFSQAEQCLARAWDKRTADLLRARGATAVKVADKFAMRSFAAVAVGADRGALSRAYSDGVKVAGELVAGMDLDECTMLLRSLQDTLLVNELMGLNRQIQALARDGAAAAGRGDSAALLQEIRDLTALSVGKR